MNGISSQPSQQQHGFGVASLSSGSAAANTVIQQDRGVAALLVMMAVLCFIFAYCCWGAPFCRSFCKRYCCCCRCRADDTDSESGGFNSVSGAAAGVAATAGQHAHRHRHQDAMGTPTIILLPHGRMLVVDSTIFSQLQAENTGLDLVELGESVLRAQRNSSAASRHHQLQNSQGSIIDTIDTAETPSKDSMGSLGCFPPPTYESIYGKEEASDMPPTYSDVLLHRFANLPYELELRDYERGSKDEIEMRSLDNCPHIIGNPFSGLAYASQSLPRRNRNPSLRSNPFDSYRVDNEMAETSQRRQRRCCQQTDRRTRRTSCHNIYEIANEAAEPRQRRYSHSRTEDLAGSEIVLDNRFNEAWERSDALRNSSGSRSDDLDDDDDDDVSRTNATYATSRSEDSILDDEMPQLRVVVPPRREGRLSEPISWNLNSLDVRLANDPDRRDAEEDTSNFNTLPDIRESRV